MAKADLTAEQVRQAFLYDPDTGIMSRRNGKARPFKAKSNGYIVCGFGGKSYQVHRLAWLISHGVWPVNVIDHINRDKTDNRLRNLRDVTHSENLLNSDRSDRAAPRKAKRVRELPKRVYAKHGAYYFVCPKDQRWVRLCAIADGRQGIEKALGLRQRTNF